MADLPPTYMIRTLNDFQSVPDDRLEECLEEFATYLLLNRGIGNAITALAGEPINTELTYFEWIDDGERNVTLTLDCGDGSVEVSGPTIAQAEADWRKAVNGGRPLVVEGADVSVGRHGPRNERADAEPPKQDGPA